MFQRKQQAPPQPTHPAIERARKVANLLDSAFTIPIIRKKVGLDPLLGMLPVGGDFIAALLGLYIVYVAYEVGLPGHVLLRMGFYIILDILLGLLPVVGDMADFFWKSNRHNLKLLEAAYQQHGGRDNGSSARFRSGYYPSTISVKAEPV
jgi:hypothetical protein